MKAVIDCRLSLCFLVPVVDAFDEGLTFVLHSEVNDASGAAMRRGNGARAKVVGRFGSAEWKFHVRVRIDATWDD